MLSRFLFDEVPRELAEFLHYLEETTDERAASTDSQRTGGSIGGCVRLAQRGSQVEVYAGLGREIL
ncbi:MAG: hypothetical protein ACLTT1_12510 [[Clostridium] scindens]